MNKIKYPKINTLYKRDMKNNGRIIEGDYSDPAFDSIKFWHVSEKVDGTNIRIFWDGEKVTFGGRTDNAQIPTFLLDELMATFTAEKMSNAMKSDSVTLFGEGYGPKIQKGGGLYSDKPSFVLFDAHIGGMWCKPDTVTAIANGLNIRRVHQYGFSTITEVLDIFKIQGDMAISPLSGGKREIEGIVARSHPFLLFQKGTPVMFKLKIKDFKHLEKTNR